MGNGTFQWPKFIVSFFILEHLRFHVFLHVPVSGTRVHISSSLSATLCLNFESV